MPNKLDVLPSKRKRPQITNAAAAAHALRYGNAPAILRIEGLNLQDLKAAVQGLKRFNAEATPEERAAWMINIPRDPEHDEPDDGVIRRDPEEKKDWKAFSHHRLDTLRVVERSLAGYGLSMRAWQKDEWLPACQRLLQPCIAEFNHLMMEFDAILPGEQLYDRALACADQHVLRILQYQPRTGIIAAKHPDRDGVTFSLWESLPGLFGDRGGKKIYCDRPEFPNAVAFPGTQLQNITDNKILAFEHGVENLDPTHERFAVVFFGKLYGLDGVGS